MKIIESPIERWAGTIGLRENLYLNETTAFNDALRDAGFYDEDEEVGKKMFTIKLSDFVDVLPIGLGFIEEWNIDKLKRPTSIKDFPGNPIGDASKFASWLLGEMFELVLYGDEVPNE